MVAVEWCFRLTSVALLHGLLRAASAAPVLEEEFYENLKLTPLPDGRLLTRFDFKTLLRDAAPRAPHTLAEEDEPQHYNLFPLALGQLLREHAVTELHLTLNAGQWNYAAWGQPEDSGVATGAELWAWMGESRAISVKDRWKGITNGLAGLFCATLGGLDVRRTVSPSVAFQPEGDIPSSTPHHLLYAPLPSESVCTENLTPFLKLLPCKSRSGVASLLNPHRLFDADWHGMGVHVTWEEGLGVMVRMNFVAVYNPTRLMGLQNKRDWSFRLLFDRSITRACPVATRSAIHVALPSEGNFRLEPTAHSNLGNIAIFDVSKVQEPLELSMKWPDESEFDHTSFAPSLSPPLTVRRVLTGAGQSQGALAVSLSNTNTETMRVAWVETMPWFIKFYLHTLEATIKGERRNDLVKLVTYAPTSSSSQAPTLLESHVTIPGNTTLRLTIDLEKSFISYTQHPPAAQRGWDLPGGIIAFTSHSSHRGEKEKELREQRIYTPILLVDLPTPDFSMPYNVIIMTSTLVTLLFGTIFNMLTRKFVWIKLHE
ncbi:hypothetical protein BOTBODRAFT_67994 [Botryobasidium botryosum FD-172 SS1]|uniref:GPI transamidase component PIG-T n=1 Tax=Botryobasidium botryosum (strain FD-172 SS1) TaxID=930990 RepID=A0A067M9S8_BOTB1|nr:hypothetical protein BOTBODRAFT_67994 [Botryobasidium botryosum FD-172 SS1]